MGIRTGSEFIESLRDERVVYVNGERLTDVTTYPPFQGILATLASLYDLNHERREVARWGIDDSHAAIPIACGADGQGTVR